MLYRYPPARVPGYCPPNFTDKYIVKRGDALYKIAQQVGISVANLITANPHITDPNILYIGDILCIPGPKPPCAALLLNSPRSPIKGSGSIYIQPGELTVVASLPPLEEQQDIIEYQAYVELQDPITGYEAISSPLYKVNHYDNLWAARLTDVNNRYVSRNTTITISANRIKYTTPPGDIKILQGNLLNCIQ